MSISRLYDDPFQEEPIGIVADVTIQLRMAFSDEDAYSLVDGALIDISSNAEQFDLIKARNVLYDTFYENPEGLKLKSIKIARKDLEEMASMLEADIPEKSVFHDVEVKT